AAEPLPFPSRAYMSPRISPDGRQVLTWTQGDRNVWLHDLARGTLTRLTSEGRNARAIWTLDGKRVTYGSAITGFENVFMRPVDGSGPPERLTTSPYLEFAAAWSPGDGALVWVEATPDNSYDIMAMSLTDRRPRPLVHTRFTEAYPDFSPDG